MLPNIPGLQNSWAPVPYPLPTQAPAAPPGLDPSSVYNFGSGAAQPMNKGLHAPIAPLAPGYIGPSMAQAYAMAGPRAGFQGGPAAPSAPSTGMVNPDTLPISVGGSGGNNGAGLPGSMGGNAGAQWGYGTGAAWNGLTPAGGSSYSISNPQIEAAVNPGGGFSLPSLFGDPPPQQVASTDMAIPTFSGQPMAPSPGAWTRVAPSIGDHYDVGSYSNWSTPAYLGGGFGGSSGFGSNTFGGGDWSSFGSSLLGNGSSPGTLGAAGIDAVIEKLLGE